MNKKMNLLFIMRVLRSESDDKMECDPNSHKSESFVNQRLWTQ